MKKLLIVLSMLSFFSCKKEMVNSDAKSPINSDELSEKSYYEDLVCEAGFETENMKICGEYIIVEGDIILKKDALIPNSSLEGQVTQRNYSILPSLLPERYIVSPIYYQIDPSVNGLWTTAIIDAIAEWNEIEGCLVEFLPAIVDISSGKKNETNPTSSPLNELTFAFTGASIVPSCMGNPSIASARFPSGGNVGNMIIINPDDPCSSTGCRINVIKHEIGHVLGLRHTNIDFDEGITTTVCGTNITPLHIISTSNESSSIMWAGNGSSDDPNEPLSFADKASATSMYPSSYSGTELNVVFEFQEDQQGNVIGYYFDYDIINCPTRPYKVEVKFYDSNGNIAGTDTFYGSVSGISNIYNNNGPNGCFTFYATLTDFKGAYSFTTPGYVECTP